MHTTCCLASFWLLSHWYLFLYEWQKSTLTQAGMNNGDLLAYNRGSVLLWEDENPVRFSPFLSFPHFSVDLGCRLPILEYPSLTALLGQRGPSWSWAVLLIKARSVSWHQLALQRGHWAGPDQEFLFYLTTV